MTLQTDYPTGFTRETCPGSLNAIVEEALAKLPGAIDSYVIAQAKRAADQFFRRSLCWRSTIGPFSLAVGQDVLYINPADGYSRVCMIFDVTIDGQPLLAASNRQAAFNTSGGELSTAFYTDPPDVVHFVPTPGSATDDVRMNVALVPIFSDESLPEWVIDQHYEGILAGVLSRLYGEPDKPYTSLSLFEFFSKRFRSEIAQARTVTDRGYVAGTLKVPFPPWA